jgi:hypothetical protein
VHTHKRKRQTGAGKHVNLTFMWIAGNRSLTCELANPISLCKKETCLRLNSYFAIHTWYHYVPKTKHVELLSSARAKEKLDWPVDICGHRYHYWGAEYPENIIQEQSPQKDQPVCCGAQVDHGNTLHSNA